ncbi:sigma factor-like helix-turn-helix DNA-binding protein [Streptomyces sp. NPDC005931]|uniref:sigma factor-like helix-turn-helix DNA-binding protein n=1 Tax=Streptomyces sp. NPDC005931 TaxID=3364737 RepID=UPI0036990AEF
MNTGAGIHPSAVRVRRDLRGTPSAAFDSAAAPEDFAAYARDRWPQLLATACLFTRDARSGEELARRTLVRVCARWRRVPRNDVDFHVRRCLVRGHLRGRAGLLGGGRERVVLVLRYWDGLSETEIAQVLGCSVGAVRALVRRGTKRASARRKVPAGRGRAVLRAGFAAELDGSVPPELPLDGIQREGAARRRRRMRAVAAGCALLLAPPAVLAADQFGSGSATGSAEAADGVVPGPVRIVAPGERVAAAPGVEVWLTPDGKHWSSPQAPNQFRAAGDANLAPGEPGVSAQVEPVRGRYFLSGLYHGLSGDAVRVEVGVGERRITADVLTLAGDRDWGVWYASAPLTGPGGDDLLAGGGNPTVTVYDAAGDVVARSDIGVGVGADIGVVPS